jgi:hypothetical protein
MFTKLKVALVALALLLGAATPMLLPTAETAFAQGEVNEADTGVASSELMRVLREEMTLVWLQDETYAYITAACAGSGLNNIQPLPDGPMVLIPNAGDLAVDGSNVSIKLNPDGVVNFIPRTQGQKIRVPIDVGDKVAGQEVLSLTMAEAEQLAAAGKLIWTAGNQGPFGTGHGLAGHIAACDPQFRPEFITTTTDDE